MRHHTGKDYQGHKVSVRITHWIVALSFFTLAFSGFIILMCHPRLYWGETGNELTPALLELPISRNHHHEGWEKAESFFTSESPVVSASRTYEIFNQNGWGRSLHFLSAWFLVVSGLVYVLTGIFSGHFKRNLLPKLNDFTFHNLFTDLRDHLRFRIPKATGGPDYGYLQKLMYIMVIFIIFPLAIVTGFAMSPAITNAFHWVSGMFGGMQSARTIHFFTSLFLEIFLIIHIVMILVSGFGIHLRSMLTGK